MIVVGFQPSSGEYQGYEYDNVKIHCLKPADTEKGQEGQLSEIIKVPRSKFLELNISVGDNIVPFYDKYGRLIDIH